MEIEQFAQSINACDVQDYSGNQIMSKLESSWARRPEFRRGHYFVLNIDNETYFFIIKISRSHKPFWGVGKKFIEFFNKCSTVKYYLILLDSNNSGWFFSKEDIDWNISHNYWSYSEPDFKINFGVLLGTNRFMSQKGFLKFFEGD